MLLIRCNWPIKSPHKRINFLLLINWIYNYNIKFFEFVIEMYIIVDPHFGSQQSILLGYIYILIETMIFFIL